MNNQLFKVGDKVYYPLMSDKILTLLKHGEDTVNVDLGLGNFFELNGKKFQHHLAQSIFHATQLNYELLTNLYPHIQFEKPRPTPDTIVKKMLNDGYAYVICNILLPDGVVKDIVRGYKGISFLGESGNYYYDEVIPLDNYTGKVIVDYIDSKPVLEDE